MKMNSPVAAYTAKSNLEAAMVCDLLINVGIDSYVVEDVSGVGVWWGGMIPHFHRPQVWIDESDLEKARPVLLEYERGETERRKAKRIAGSKIGPAEAKCDGCGKTSFFPEEKRGTIQICPHCRAYVDVSGGVEIDGWDVPREQ